MPRHPSMQEIKHLFEESRPIQGEVGAEGGGGAQGPDRGEKGC